jgi:hypothetical protein
VPPAIRTFPLKRGVAVWVARAVVMLPVGENGPFTLGPVPPPVVLVGVVETGDAGDVGDVGELLPHATISEAAQSRSDIENVRMVCLLIHFSSSD